MLIQTVIWVSICKIIFRLYKVFSHFPFAGFFDISNKEKDNIKRRIRKLFILNQFLLTERIKTRKFNANFMYNTKKKSA